MPGYSTPKVAVPAVKDAQKQEGTAVIQSKMLKRSPAFLHGSSTLYNNAYTPGRLRYSHNPGNDNPIDNAPTIKLAFRKLVSAVDSNASL